MKIFGMVAIPFKISNKLQVANYRRVPWHTVSVQSNFCICLERLPIYCTVAFVQKEVLLYSIGISLPTLAIFLDITHLSGQSHPYVKYTLIVHIISFQHSRGKIYLFKKFNIKHATWSVIGLDDPRADYFQCHLTCLA